MNGDFCVFLTRCSLLLVVVWEGLASILSFPSSPVVANTLRFTVPRTERIFLKTVTVFKRETIAFRLPVKHKVHAFVDPYAGF